MNNFDQQDFDKLNTRIADLLSSKLITNRKYALIYLFLRHRLYREQFEIEDSFTDGGNDCGVDAIHIEYRSEDPIVHIFQSKVHDSTRKASNPFKVYSAEKVIRFIEVLRNRDADLSKLVNPRLEQKIYEIRDLQEKGLPDIKFWIISNGSACIPHELLPLRQRMDSEDVEMEEFHLANFLEFCVNAHSLRMSHTFYAREAGVVEFGSSELRSFVGYISARQLYDIIKDVRDDSKLDYSVFNMNVRGFLGLDNQVNKDIFKTAASSENSHFASLNNGITIVGTQCKHSKAGTDKPKIRIKQMSIVNGAQTCYAIFEAMKDYRPNFDAFDKLSVLFRVFETDDPELIAKISVSTNNQNRISSRDLRANDELQMRIEAELKTYGVNYMRKRGDNRSSESQGIALDAFLAGQLILSYIQHDPVIAKRGSDSIFAENYKRVFSGVSIHKILRAMKWFELIQEKRNIIIDDIRIRGLWRTKDAFVTYGAFHILMMCSLINGEANDDQMESVIEKAIEIISDSLKEKGEPAYYSYFRDQRHVEELHIAAIQQRII